MFAPFITTKFYQSFVLERTPFDEARSDAALILDCSSWNLSGADFSYRPISGGLLKGGRICNGTGGCLEPYDCMCLGSGLQNPGQPRTHKLSDRINILSET